MKTNLLTLLLVLCLIGNTTISYAQENQNDDISKMYNAQKKLVDAFNSMLKTETINNRKDNKPCKTKDLIGLVNKSELELNTNELHAVITSLFTKTRAIATAETIDQGAFATLTDKGLNAISNGASFDEFIKAYTGKDIKDINGKTEFRGEILSKDIDVLQEYYQNLKEIKANHEFSQERSVSDKCAIKSENSISVKTINYPNATWDIKTTITVDCVCGPDDGVAEVKSGSYEYTSTISGTLTGSNITFNSSKNPKLSVLSLECCGKKKEEEPPYIDPIAALNDNGIKDLMPDQTIGFGAGIGFAQDFEETTWCVTAEYLYKINTNQNKGWYVGGEVTHSNTSFGDFNSNKTVAGGKIQYNISAVPSGETQFVAGLMANYAFGNNDFNGFKDDFTGTIFCAYGGVNVRVSENWSIGAQFPVLIFENFTFKPENSAEFKTDATSLFINKDNPLKIMIRRRL
jgi:hypothetical protein